MDAKPISPNVWVSGQILPQDMEKLKDLGFRAIICNRPDGEEEGQPGWTEIAAAAKQAGLGAIAIPVTPHGLNDTLAAEFRAAVTAFEKPVLAYCLSGARSAALWALAARDRLSADEVIRMAATAGYDLEVMRERLELGAQGTSGC